MYALWISRNDLQIRARRPVRLTPTLFPVSQGTERDLITRSEFFLSETQRST
jgi:hypothetical protein